LREIFGSSRVSKSKANKNDENYSVFLRLVSKIYKLRELITYSQGGKDARPIGRDAAMKFILVKKKLLIS